MSFANETPLDDVFKYVRNPPRARRIPMAFRSMSTRSDCKRRRNPSPRPWPSTWQQVPLRTSLSLLLNQLGLAYQVKDGLLKITSENSADQDDRQATSPFQVAWGHGWRHGAIAGAEPGRPGREDQSSGGQRSGRRAARRGRTGPDASPAEKDGPSVTFSIAGRLDIPSRRDPQLLEVARVDLAAEYYAKAVPVLTPRVYRLAKLTNKSDFVILPGEATVYVGGDFVGRMRLPLVAAGEPFIAGFGVDPQLQVSRRLVHKTRSVQGGNQIFDYEFRIGLRNYRPGPVKVQLWDRLPKPQGEAVAVNLVKTSSELSTDASLPAHRPDGQPAALGRRSTSGHGR